MEVCLSNPPHPLRHVNSLFLCPLSRRQEGEKRRKTDGEKQISFLASEWDVHAFSREGKKQAESVRARRHRGLSPPRGRYKTNEKTELAPFAPPFVSEQKVGLCSGCSGERALPFFFVFTSTQQPSCTPSPPSMSIYP